MNIQSMSQNRKAGNFLQMQCFVIFMFLLIPFIYGISFLENKSLAFFHTLLFFAGWLTFTFFEYIAHRFWMHGKEKKDPGKSLEQHMHHHRHPTELKITTGMRNKLLFINFLLIAIAAWLNNYFTFFAGLFFGFVYYCFMHVFLHKPWAKKIFPRLQSSHIHHHCKYPDRCFSSCLTWWDRLFRTNVPNEIKISERVVQFYFGNNHH